MEEKEIIKTIKVAIKYINKENKMGEKNFFKELNDILYKSYLAYNRVLTYLYTNTIQKEIGLPKQNDKELYGKSFLAWCENRMNEIIEGFNSSNIAQARQMVNLIYNNNKKKILKGEISLPQFKRENTPIIIHNNNYKIIETPKGLGIEISIFNKNKLKELNMKVGERVKFLFPRINKGEREILRRMFDGSYKQGMAQFVYNKKKRKWELAMSYKFIKEENKELNSNLVMGIDVGIAKAVVFSILDVEKNEYKWLRYNECCIDGRELIHFRDKVEARRREIYKSCKWASKNNIGHGRKARTAKADEISDKIARFRDTYNHKISRYVVDMALKNNVGCIQLENLSGFTEHQKDKFLRQWAYYDLQNKITYKAEEAGIVVNKINPQYTSKRCNKCGCIDDRNRDCKKDQANFTCVVCGHKENADINASKNICIPNIEKIIEEQLKGIS